MSKSKEILIVGAGPSGLSMAIFLNELGYHPRIIDKKKGISEYSKALAVNPRTLELFEPLGLTKKFLANGRKMEAINIWIGDKHLFKNEFSKIKHQYPFMLVQPQKESEEILLEELRSRNIEVEFDTAFESFETTGNGYSICLDRESQNQGAYDYIIGADGGRSMVRKQIGIDLDGYRYTEDWELYDVELDINQHPDEGHIRIFPEGGLIMIRLKGNYWRVAGSMASVLEYLPKDARIGEIIWQSTFKIHHKVAQSLSKDQIGIIGDAAHLHSPVGARGMNLGIEDAYLLSKLIHEGQMDRFTAMRKPYLKKTVGRINNLTMGMAGNTAFAKTVRQQMKNFKFLFPLIMPRVRKFIMGVE